MVGMWLWGWHSISKLFFKLGIVKSWFRLLFHGDGGIMGMGSQATKFFARYCVKSYNLYSKVMLPTTTHMRWWWVWNGGKIEKIFARKCTLLKRGLHVTPRDFMQIKNKLKLYFLLIALTVLLSMEKHASLHHPHEGGILGVEIQVKNSFLRI